MTRHSRRGAPSGDHGAEGRSTLPLRLDELESLRPIIPSLESWVAMTHEDRRRLMQQVQAWNRLLANLQEPAYRE